MAKKEKSQKKASKASRLKKTILGIAIALVLVFFIGYSVDTFYKEPRYEDFCGEREARMMEYTKEECESAQGKWNPSPIKEVPNDRYSCTKISEEGDSITLNCVAPEDERQTGYCDIDYYCRQDLDNKREAHGKVAFIVLVIIGLIAIITGSLLYSVEAVGSGVMGGGVLTLLYAAIRYWGDIPDYGRLSVLGIALAVLIWIGYKRLKD